jgi:Ser/Thr protein kinase RdoA (MazF antagonist)
VIHADLFTDNVFFIGDAVSGLIDFYFACTDALAYDLAISLNAWCFDADGTFHRDKAGAMIAGYNAVRRLDSAEIGALPVLARGAAMRFMLTRLVDWLNVPPGALVQPKDPLEYDRRLSFHRTAQNARGLWLAGVVQEALSRSGRGLGTLRQSTFNSASAPDTSAFDGVSSTLRIRTTPSSTSIA